MPRARGDKEYRLPVKGLNTEANVLDFPQEAAVDLTNLELELNPMKLKVRKGHTFTVATNRYSSSSNEGDHAVTSFLWKAVAGDSETNLLCIQIAGNLVFIDASSTDLDSSVGGVSLVLSDIASGTVKGTSALSSFRPLQYTSVKGDMVITSEAINPTLVEYDVATDTLTFSEMAINIRDTEGLESGVTTDTRAVLLANYPAADTASSTYPTMTENHEYNLYNQGWYQDRRVVAAAAEVDVIANFITDTSSDPSNADIVYLGMVESSGSLIFDADWLEDHTFGSSPAPRGHYVVDAFDIDRAAIILDKDDSGEYTGGGKIVPPFIWVDIPGDPL